MDNSIVEFITSEEVMIALAIGAVGVVIVSIVYLIENIFNKKKIQPVINDLVVEDNPVEEVLNLQVVPEVIEVDSKDKNETNWQDGKNQVLSNTGKLDVVFAGDDYKGKNIWENLYKESEIYYFKRNEIEISSTLIRQNPYKYFEYLPRCVRKDYIKKVCIIGTESCGKSTLVRNLAKYFNTSYVEEAGRYVCEDAGGIDNMTKDDYFKILFKQKELERNQLELANKVLLIDTDSLITYFYYSLMYKDNDEYDKKFKLTARAISDLNNYDLYLFLEPDVPFFKDITRSDGDNREFNNNYLKQILKDNNIKYETISGDYNNRYKESKEKILKILK